MRVCYFGYYDQVYARNRVLIKGLKENGVEVVECNDRSGFLTKYIKLIFKYWRLKGKIDALVIGFSSPLAVPLAKILAPRKLVVYDAFTSLYESDVVDRRLYGSRSLMAKYRWFIDWLAASLADVVLTDTNEHLNYFASEFGVKKEKLRRIFAGSDIYEV